MIEDPHRPSGTDFGVAADDYRRGRPDYPTELVSWLRGDATRIVDVGAGTGKLTASLVGPGREVTAIDPDPRMLATLGSDLPEVHPHRERRASAVAGRLGRADHVRTGMALG